LPKFTNRFAFMDIKDDKNDHILQDVSLEDTPKPEINEIDALVKRIEEFKKEVSEHRKKLGKDESFREVDKDDAYKVLLDKSAFYVEDDEEADYSHYPFGHTLYNRNKEARQEDPEYPTINFDNVENKEYKKVYLKAFYEGDENDTINPENLEGKTKKELAKKFMESRHKSIEEFIYENVMNIIGILFLTIGVLYLISQGVEIGLLSEGSRLLVGGIFAGVLVFIANQLRDKNPAFSVLFVISGIIIMYYCSFVAYRDYHLLPQVISFMIDIFVTALALFFAVYHSRQVLAVVALAGGYISPFFVDINENYDTFFIYVFIINVLILGIAYIKNWEFLNWSVFSITVIFNVWQMIAKMNAVQSEDFFSAMLFAPLFFILFFSMIVVRSLRPYIPEGDPQLSGWDYTVYFTNVGLFYFIIFHYLRQTQLVDDYLGLFGIGLGIFHAIFVTFIKPHPRQDTTLTNYSLFIALGLITFSPTIYVSGTLQLTFFWVFESAVLLFISKKSKIQLLTDASAIVLGLGIVMLFSTWTRTYYFNENIDVVAFFNDAVYGSFFTVIGLGVMISLLLQMGKNSMVVTFSTETYTGILGGLIIFIVYVTGAIELNFHPFTNRELTRLIIGIYNTTFITLFWFWTDRNSVGKIQRTAEYILVFIIASYLFYGHPSTIELRMRYLAEDPATPLSHFMTHYINVILAFVGMYLMLMSNYKKAGEGNTEFASMLWIACAVFVFHLSAELDHLMVLFNYNPTFPEEMNEVLKDTHRILYPILWGVISFLLMYTGMRYKIASLRMMSLVLFGVILVKFFIFDFRAIDTTNKIISLIFIGGLLLLISYLYNQLRVMVLEGELDTEAIKAMLQGKQKSVSQDRERFERRNLQKEHGIDQQEENEQHTPPPVPPSSGLDDE
jgi:uncharacterized membrane protein